jgi:hypothetical protein
VTVGGHILEAAEEQSGIDPAGIHHHVAALAVAIAGHTRLEIIRMEAEHAAIVWRAVIEVDVVEQSAGYVFRGHHPPA